MMSLHWLRGLIPEERRGSSTFVLAMLLSILSVQHYRRANVNNEEAERNTVAHVRWIAICPIVSTRD